MYQCRAQFYISSRTVFHTTSLSYKAYDGDRLLTFIRITKAQDTIKNNSFLNSSWKLSSRTVFHRTWLSPGGYHIKRMMGTNSWYLLELRKFQDAIMNNSFLKSSWKISSMKFNPIEIISAPLLSRQSYHPLIQLLPKSVPQIRLATCVYYDGWMKYIRGSQRTTYCIWLWKKLCYSHRPTPEGWR